MIRARSLKDRFLFFPVLLGTLVLGVAVFGVTLVAPQTAHAADTGTISGVVTNQKTKERIPNALVVLQCTCLQGTRETQTNDNGLYAFRNLPPGTYTIQVLAGQADVSKVTTLPRGAKFRADFTMDPNNEFKRVVRVKANPVKQGTSVGRTVSMEEFRNVPIGSNTGRDFTQVVESSATASQDSAGISLAGTTSAESKYTVEGANVNNPSFGTVGASIVQEFIEEVEVQESGYEAEFGGAAGGQVSARRVSGTNKVRGIARFTYTPRLARPRFILATDNAVRATETPDYLLQGVVSASGPIIKDRLFWSAGISATGGAASLVQTFHAREDRDNSGGFEDCPFENGEFDCADGGDFIQTRKFAEQKFRTGQVGIGYVFGLDWAINPKHRLSASVIGGPSFQRRSFRRPALNLDPSAFGSSLNADPLGGGSSVANGVVNDHFGWDRGNFTTVTLNYLGRVANDKLEIDAGLGYSQFASEEAWRMDNPEFYDLPATQEQDSEGENLFNLLDRDGRLDLVPGVKENCNDSDLPGLACPVRRWLSGGIGNYSRDTSRRVEGRIALTHFFNAAGSHQLKYGTQIEHLERKTVSQYSGRNADNFYNNCADMGLEGAGEYCYDPSADQYLIGADAGQGTRVNNSRLIFVDTDNPDDRTAIGLWSDPSARQGELRAIASPLGAGVRVDGYRSTPSRPPKTTGSSCKTGGRSSPTCS